MGPIRKLHNNIVHIRKSANHTAWFKDRAGKIIPLDNCTKWNSWFTMLSVALEDKVKAGLQLYVEHYQDNISKDDILTTKYNTNYIARIFNPQCRIAFLKDGNGRITTKGEKKLYIVRKLWERFRDKLLFSAVLYESESVGKHTLQPEENLSAFHKVCRMQILKQTRPASQDEFDNYINENPVMLDNDTTAIQ
ncbi:hypothetical protein TSTA_126320 [Talaromyces stipitatus ATCC 10500]|uniref:Uncharacterized protein n=1 Tax=Talaromyces stipitatus (strain ATCC 10500 / CBS 375.48 / QM 6759 / NRRL 1006) TaxID=441959 RepID=B8MBD5_TALSN|nr:uncharacterized protein TSTA_126320 [Talaromyces stipitatus ATCC 10500]EED18924.1 hypothetical protein TSTA_126320 [Talaromyces stipitatus ATCC 10500]